MFAHPSTSATLAFADRRDDGTAAFAWDWESTRKRTAVGLIAFYSATRSLYEYLGWKPPALDAWVTHLRRFVLATEPQGEL